MGHFYQNFTVRGVSRDSLVAALAGREAFIGPTVGECIVVFDRRSEDESNTELGLDISERFNCPVLAVANHDDDVLFYQLFESMTPVDEYSSSPGYFDLAAPRDERPRRRGAASAPSNHHIRLGGRTETLSVGRGRG